MCGSCNGIMGGVLDSKLRGLDSRPGLVYVLHSQAKHFNPLHPNISMHILHTVLYTFPNVLTRRICLTIEKFFN